jgi:predicted outer membrane repeat protein
LQGNSDFGGGALRITETIDNKVPTNEFRITSSTFENCSNVNGGAISLIDLGNAIIDGVTLFKENSAQQAGGAIYFSCSNFGLDLSKCSLIT